MALPARLTGRGLNALGVSLATFLSFMVVFKSFSEITFDSLYQPMIQSLLTGLAALGIGPASAWLTANKKKK